MPRNITSAFRLSSHSTFTDEVDLVFLTITHADLGSPIRVVWDTKDYVKGGFTFVGFPFDLELLTDDESPPTARLQIQNVSPQIGASIGALTSAPRLKIELCSSADFDLTVTPRVESAGSPPAATVIYSADQLFLTNVTVDAITVSGQIVGWDYVQRVWPAERATRDNFPGLFRA